MIPGGCSVAPGKPLKVTGEPSLAEREVIYDPSPSAGGLAGVTEKCPKGSWVTGLSAQADQASLDKMGIVGKT